MADHPPRGEAAVPPVPSLAKSSLPAAPPPAPRSVHVHVHQETPVTAQSDQMPPLPKITDEMIEAESMLRWFTYDHLPERLKWASIVFAGAAVAAVELLPRCPERTVCLRKLLEAKDCAVRSLL
jgi:hypothetical protein